MQIRQGDVPDTAEQEPRALQQARGDPLLDLVGLKLSPGGAAARLTLGGAHQAHAFELSSKDLIRLAVSILRLAAQRRFRLKRKLSFPAFEVRWCKVGLDAEGATTLAFETEGGVELAFRMPQSAASSLREAIGIRLGEVEAVPASTVRN